MKRILLVLAVVAVILVGELIFPISVSAAPPADGPIVGQLYEIFGMISVYTGPTFDSVRHAINSGTFTVVQTKNFDGVLWTEVVIHSAIVPGVRGNYWVQEGIFSWGKVRTMVPAVPAVPAPSNPAPVIPLFPNPNLFPPYNPCWPWNCPNRRWA